MSRLAEFMRDPGPTVLLACLVVAGTGLAFGMAWVPPAVALVLLALVMMTPGGPQHPVPA